MERENLFSDVKGQATSGSNCEGESTEAERRDGAAHSSNEGSVMGWSEGAALFSQSHGSWNLRVDTLISIRFIAHWPSQSSATARSQLARGSSFPLSLRTRGRSIATLPAWKPILP